MIKRKEKICVLCGKPKFIFSKGRCITCAQKSYVPKDVKRTPIAKMSPKRKTETLKYLGLRMTFINEHTRCEVIKPRCSNWTTDVHHTFSGKDRSKYYLDTTTWIPTCRNCHNWIHLNSKEAREEGLLK